MGHSRVTIDAAVNQSHIQYLISWFQIHFDRYHSAVNLHHESLHELSISYQKFALKLRFRQFVI